MNPNMTLQNTNIAKLILFIFSMMILMSTLSSCDGESEKTNLNEVTINVEIVSAKLHRYGEPDGYRGQAIEFVLSRILDENSEVRFKIDIETHTGFTISGEGFLTTPRSLDQPTEKWLKNVYLWIPRHDPLELRKGVEEEVKPGNIKQLRIQLTERRVSFSKPTTVTIIADRVFSNL